MVDKMTKTNGLWDIRQHYKTVSHSHMSMFDDGDDLIDLMLVECADGQWFIEVVSLPFESDDLFDAYADDFSIPRFFSSCDEAERFACELIAENTSLSFDSIYPYFEGEEED